MTEALPFWAREQLKLRQTFEQWLGFEIDRYEAEGSDKLFGAADGLPEVTLVPNAMTDVGVS